MSIRKVQAEFLGQILRLALAQGGAVKVLHGAIRLTCASWPDTLLPCS